MEVQVVYDNSEDVRERLEIREGKVNETRGPNKGMEKSKGDSIHTRKVTPNATTLTLDRSNSITPMMDAVCEWTTMFNVWKQE